MSQNKKYECNWVHRRLLTIRRSEQHPENVIPSAAKHFPLIIITKSQSPCMHVPLLAKADICALMICFVAPFAVRKSCSFDSQFR